MAVKGGPGHTRRLKPFVNKHRWVALPGCTSPVEFKRLRLARAFETGLGPRRLKMVWFTSHLDLGFTDVAQSEVVQGSKRACGKCGS